MAVRNLWLLGGGLAACVLMCGDGYPQQPPGPALPAIPPPAVPAAPAPPPSTTVEQLIDRLTELRKQKAELERREQLTIKELRDKLRAQSERLAKLGIAPEPPAPAEGKGEPLPGPVTPPSLPE